MVLPYSNAPKRYKMKQQTVWPLIRPLLHSDLRSTYTVCPDLSVQKLRITSQQYAIHWWAKNLNSLRMMCLVLSGQKQNKSLVSGNVFLGLVDREFWFFWKFFYIGKSTKIIQNNLKIEEKFSDVQKKFRVGPKNVGSVGFLETRLFFFFLASCLL